MSIFKLSILPTPFKEWTKPVMVLVIISRGKMELKEGSSVKIPYEDGFFNEVCAVNCIYLWPDSIADLNDNLSGIQPKCYPLSSLTWKGSCSDFVVSLEGLEL